MMACRSIPSQKSPPRPLAVGLRRPPKYRNRRTEIDGLKFDSTGEAARYSYLLILQRAGKISNLRRQPEYELHALGGEKIGVYRADFDYLVPCHGLVTEDLKGFKTALFNWKRKHFEAEYKRPLHVTTKTNADIVPSFGPIARRRAA